MLITFILSLTVSGKSKGVDVKSGEFFRNAGRSGLMPEAEPIHRSTFTKSRSKVDWRIFRDILNDTVRLAYEYWPDSPKYSWHGMSVFGIDGSKYNLPATEEVRKEFDPHSGLQYCGKGHYPQCLVSTVYDVFRRLPIARVVKGVHSSERQHAKELMGDVPAGNVLVFDRGYPGYEFISYLLKEFNGYFIMRCPAQYTFPEIEEFIRSGKEESEVYVAPSASYMSKLPVAQRKELKRLRLRVIRMVSPDGTVSVLLSNLFDKEKYPRQEIIDLYFKRWEVESYYRDEKVVLEVERFHGKSCNSIRQELFAAAIMTVITRTLMKVSSDFPGERAGEPQFKNAVMTLASEVTVLIADNPIKALEVFEAILKEIDRVRYYRPKLPRPSQPRVSKKSINKWTLFKSRKAARA